LFFSLSSQNRLKKRRVYVTPKPRGLLDFDDDDHDTLATDVDVEGAELSSEIDAAFATFDDALAVGA
jgi:hypothetical protein